MTFNGTSSSRLWTQCWRFWPKAFSVDRACSSFRRALFPVRAALQTLIPTSWASLGTADRPNVLNRRTRCCGLRESRTILDGLHSDLHDCPLPIARWRHCQQRLCESCVLHECSSSTNVSSALLRQLVGSLPVVNNLWYGVIGSRMMSRCAISGSKSILSPPRLSNALPPAIAVTGTAPRPAASCRHQFRSKQHADRNRWRGSLQVVSITGSLVDESLHKLTWRRPPSLSRG